MNEVDGIEMFEDLSNGLRDKTESLTGNDAGRPESVVTEVTSEHSSNEATGLRSPEVVVLPVSPVPDVKVARLRRKDIMADDARFRFIDEQAKRVPVHLRQDVETLAQYLGQGSKMEQVRAFYIWITHNIEYDTSGYFGRAPLRSTDPASVLHDRVTVCEGYVKLMEALCREADIPVKIICGFAKSFGTKAEEDVTENHRNAHAWNAVFLDNDWFLLDVTWGAGFVKSREKKYIARFNNAYFLTDPEVFITDHFPSPVKGFENYESDSVWQILKHPFSKKKFLTALNFEKHGKEWGIEAVSHDMSVIRGVEGELDIVLQETYVKMGDYVAFLFEDNRKLDNFVYTYMLTTEKVNVHVCLPKIGVFEIQVYGRRLTDGPRADFQPIVKYMVQCTKAHKEALPYPTHPSMYGASRDLNTYGVSDVGKVYHVAEEGELILTIKPTRFIDIFPRLLFQDNSTDLKSFCFVDFSDDFKDIQVVVRLSYTGFYKLILFARQKSSSKFTPFVTYLLKCNKACEDGHFPDAHEYALTYKCCIFVPLIKFVVPKSNLFVCLKSPVLIKVKCGDVYLEKVDDVTFEGTILTPGNDVKFSIEGCDKTGIFHPLYSYKTRIEAEK